jgi:hypothetical protein
MKASSAVIGFSGRFVTVDGAGGLSYNGLVETRRVERPGNICGRASMKDQESMLFFEMSRDVRLDEKTRSGSVVCPSVPV